MVQRWRRRRHGASTLGLAALAVAMAACLPRGAPPGGRQVVADRKATLEAIVPPNGDGVLRILILKPGAVADSRSSTSSRSTTPAAGLRPSSSWSGTPTLRTTSGASTWWLHAVKSRGWDARGLHQRAGSDGAGHPLHRSSERAPVVPGAGFRERSAVLDGQPGWRGTLYGTGRGHGGDRPPPSPRVEDSATTPTTAVRMFSLARTSTTYRHGSADPLSALRRSGANRDRHRWVPGCSDARRTPAECWSGRRRMRASGAPIARSALRGGDGLPCSFTNLSISPDGQ